MKNRRILIIGGGGFLGKSMISFCKERDEIIFVGSRCLDFFNLKDYDVLIHAGASADPKYNRETFIKSFEESNLTTKVLHDKILAENKDICYLYISSGCVNFSSKYTIDNSYLELKRTGELYAYNLLNENINAKIVRLFSVVGKYINLDSSLAVNTFIKNGLNGEKLIINSNAKNIIRSYLYSDEMCSQILSSIDSRGYIFEIGSDDEISIQSVAETVAEYYNIDIDIVDTKFYSNTVERQLPSFPFVKPFLSSKEAIKKTLILIK